MLTKYLVKREARKILRGIETLDTSKEIINDLARWRRAAASLIKEVYSEGSDLYSDLQSIRIEYPIELDESGKPIFHHDLTDGQQRQQVQLNRVVESFLSTLQQTGLPFGYRAPRSKWLLSHLLTFLVTGAVAFGAMYYGFKLNQSAQPREERYKVTKAEFDHWYRNLRWQYQQGLDSVAEEVRRTESKGFAHSITLRKWLEYAEKFERQTDKTLDSFLMEYSIQGGDTLTLEYKRKPLGNLPQELRNSRAYKR